MKIYKIVRLILRPYFRIFYKMEVIGKNNIPIDGSVLIISNHISVFDPIVLGCAIDREIHFMAKEELFKNKFFAKVMYTFGSFPVKRDSSDRKALKKGIDILSQQEVLGIFPEGTRSLNGEIGRGLPGAAFIALKSNTSIVPIGIVSEYKLFDKIIIKIGKPISMEPYKMDKITSDLTIEVTEYLMKNIKIEVDGIKK
ncbi:MAG: lysophospholipid acyltransferase family protein [Vulcanibacillus sp.]